MFKLNTVAFVGLLTATSAVAEPSSQSVMMQLRDTPASQYDLGLFKLQLAASALGASIKDEYIKGTNFRIERVGLLEDIDRLDIVVYLKGDARDMSPQACQNVKEKIINSPKFSFSGSSFFKGVSAEKFEELNSSVGTKIEISSRENDSFKFEC
ncbi:hypothetical protein P2G88_01830 [Aliiglaciecola sp. CAU 1673]|uniref:hypothetical protein n=1 Tax=Aliiglaciecola sp. CAU 1673 TaxID=3032595 RepID=UPI0023DC23D6|nr:hypothetical protein [Aliiglaciecola sp. CAU 1673]MDF2176992.1 hypothetical protein [Aliiglaciecola sp. CAU 1673]